MKVNLKFKAKDIVFTATGLRWLILRQFHPFLRLYWWAH